ncbi:MAG: membrane protein insertase YidC [Pseudomonadota bacterium]
MDNSRNLLLAVALSGLLILGWDFAMRGFYPEAATSVQTEQGAQTADGAAASSGTPGAAGDASGAQAASGTIGGADAAPAGPIDLEAALKDTNRVEIDAPRLAGSINLANGRIDDITLKDHFQTVDKDSDPIRLFAPERTKDQYFAEFGVLSGGKRLPADTPWTADGDKLTPDTPVTLTRTGEDGITYAVKLEIDDNFMIAATQTVSNASETAAIIQPYALINRSSANASLSTWIAHTGPILAADGVADYSVSYECGWSLSSCYDLTEEKTVPVSGKADWVGFTDQYWFAALIPEGETASVDYRARGEKIYTSEILYEPVTLPAGETLTQSTQLFAGAKESSVLDQYEDTGIGQFGAAITWGWFWFLEKPMQWMLITLYDLVTNFGVAIMLLTLIIRGLLFPIAQKQFASMAGMKAVQPKMKAIQERYKDDKQKQQQEIMQLYKDEKVNPLAGCLPLLIQIPIFFALYKVLMLSIEMRHKPFIDFWIKDLSAADPWTILNLFGLLPFEVTGFLGIGVLAVLLGITMWLTFKLNPSATDPTQQMIFNFMPWVLMFVMAPFAAGLLLYWVTSNVLTLAQQKYLYSKHPQLRAQAEKEKAEQAQKAEKEKAEKAAKGKA